MKYMAFSLSKINILKGAVTMHHSVHNDLEIPLYLLFIFRKYFLLTYHVSIPWVVCINEDHLEHQEPIYRLKKMRISH